jgi:hypothetical protein
LQSAQHYTSIFTTHLRCPINNNLGFPLAAAPLLTSPIFPPGPDVEAHVSAGGEGSGCGFKGSGTEVYFYNPSVVGGYLDMLVNI